MTAAEKLLAGATLGRQSYGIACAQVVFGGPRGIWLECSACTRADVIHGSHSEAWEAVSTEDAALVFVRHGWTGESPILKRALCPRCSRRPRTAEMADVVAAIVAGAA